jgi:hypothetical protein
MIRSAYLAPFIVLAPLSLQGQVFFKASNSAFANPERGFYAMDYRDSTREKSGFELTGGNLHAYRAGLSKNVEYAHVTLVRRVYYLDPWIDWPISFRFKRQIQSDCDSLRKYGLKMIMQIAYGDNSDRPNHAPPEDGWHHGSAMARFSKVLSDLDDLKAIFAANADVITLYQAGWVGQYGEWWGDHSNIPPLGDDFGYGVVSYGHSDTARQRMILRKMLRSIPVSRTIALRSVRVKLYLWGTTPLDAAHAFNGSERSRIGHYNDAFQHSWNDAGTYDLLPAHGEFADTGFTKPWLARDTRFTPNGAESYGDLLQGFSDGVSVIQAMKRFHVSYQNPDFDRQLTNAWRSDGHPSSFDWMERYMGYRFQLISANLPGSARGGGVFRVRFTVTNTGTAAPFNPRGLELILVPHTASHRVVSINLYRPRDPQVDPRFWLPQDTVAVDTVVTVPHTVPAGRYTVMLNLPDPCASLHDRPEYSIRFANVGTWVPEKGYNSLLQSVDIR